MTFGDLNELRAWALDTQREASDWEGDAGADERLNETQIETALNEIGDWCSRLITAIAAASV